MPARPNPAADLARMYRERIPTAPLSNYDKIIQSRLAPHRFTGGSSGLGFLRPVSNFLKTAVESLDPRFIASEGGRSVEHVYGDARELAKSVVTGEDTLSQSPSAQAYQAAGGGLSGALAAALPYVNVATAVVPTTKVFTPAGRVALAADAAERVASRQLGQAIGRATPTVRQATADATERLAQSMASREAGIPVSALPDRPTIFMRPRIYDPNPPRINSPLEQIGPASDNSYAVGGRGGSVSFVDDQGVSTLGPAPRSGTTPDWMSTPPSERFNPTQALSPEELANLQSLQRPQAVQSQFNRAYQGTSSLPEPNPLSYNLDWSTYPSYDDVDLTRIFNNDLEASMVSPVAADKYVAQQQFRQAAVDYIRNNRVTSNLSYAIIPENYVRLNTINDLLIKHPDLQDIYVTIMQQRGM